MNDDHDAERDHDIDLASAYLDGVASAEERTRVEADPELIALVGRLATLREAVAAVAPPSERSREQALAAALAAFDAAATDGGDEAGPDARAGIAPASADPRVVAPLPPRHRWRWNHGLGVAAAGILVVAGGIALLRDDAEAPTASRDAAVTTAVLSPTAAPATSALVAPTVAADAAVDAADAQIENESASAPTSPPLQMSAAEPAAPAPAGAAEQLEVLEDSDDLRAFAITLESPPSLAEKRAACDRPGPAEAPDALFVSPNGVAHRVVVVRLDNGEFGAIDVETCEIVAETAPQG